MTAPAVVCQHCKTAPVSRLVHVKTVGSVPVNLALCECDYLRCRNTKCRRVVGNLPQGTTHCPGCTALL